MTDSSGASSDVTRHPASDDIPSGEVKTDFQDPLGFSREVRMMRTGGREDGMWNEECKGRPCYGLFDEDPVEDVSFVREIPYVTCSFRSEVKLGSRISGMINRIPCDS